MVEYNGSDGGWHGQLTGDVVVRFEMNKRNDVNLQKKEILERNKNIDVNIVNAHDKLESQLRKLGVEIKPKYSLDPPLGGTRKRLYNR